MQIHGSSEWIDYGYLICVVPGREYQINDIIWIDPNDFEENILKLNEYYVFLKRFKMIYKPVEEWEINEDIIYEKSMKNVYISVFERNQAYELLVEELKDYFRAFLRFCFDKTILDEHELKVSRLESLYQPKTFYSVYSTHYSPYDLDEVDSVNFPWFGYLELSLQADFHINITNHEVESFVNLVDNKTKNYLQSLTYHGLYFQLNFEKDIIGFLSHERSNDENQKRLDFIKKLRS